MPPSGEALAPIASGRLSERHSAHGRPRAVRAVWLILLACLPAAGAAAAASYAGGPLVLYNPSPSVPMGWYIRSGGPVEVGKLIAFRVPELGRDYVRTNIPYLVKASIIKPVAAAVGYQVCTLRGLEINGRPIGAIAARGSSGHTLPHWIGCRRLRQGEFFAVSTRIRDSFDSRYYGPITAGEILGTYRPLWTW